MAIDAAAAAAAVAVAETMNPRISSPSVQSADCSLSFFRCIFVVVVVSQSQ